MQLVLYHAINTRLVLGASGDLAKKKTYPALFGLYRNGFLPDNVHIIGYARTKMDHEDYLKRITQYIKVGDDQDKLEQFKKITDYVSGQYDDDASYIKLEKFIAQSESKRNVQKGKKNRVYYMALPPSVFIPVAQGLKRNVYTKEGSNRLVVEKPFGMDSESSNHLGRELGALFTENEVSHLGHQSENFFFCLGCTNTNSLLDLSY
jgi:glucose-6-phosphate 1-dehydrogenase